MSVGAWEDARGKTWQMREAMQLREDSLIRCAMQGRAEARGKAAQMLEA
jgi:hypothetical protein